MRGIHTKMAAGLALVALGSLAGYAVGAAPAGDQGAAATAAKRQPVEVRTRTIHRTIRIVRHEKPRRPRPQPAAPNSPPAVEPASVSQEAPAPPAAPQAATPPATTSPSVRTRTSGGGSRSGGERERGEREGEGDDD